MFLHSSIFRCRDNHIFDIELIQGYASRAGISLGVDMESMVLFIYNADNFRECIIFIRNDGMIFSTRPVIHNYLIHELLQPK